MQEYGAWIFVKSYTNAEKVGRRRETRGAPTRADNKGKNNHIFIK